MPNDYEKDKTHNFDRGLGPHSGYPQSISCNKLADIYLPKNV